MTRMLTGRSRSEPPERHDPRPLGEAQIPASELEGAVAGAGSVPGC